MLFLRAGSRIWSPRMYNLCHGTHGQPTGEAARGPHALCEPRKQSLQRPVPLTRGASGHAGSGREAELMSSRWLVEVEQQRTSPRGEASNFGAELLGWQRRASVHVL